jgi:hypothetical protein
MRRISFRYGIERANQVALHATGARFDFIQYGSFCPPHRIQASLDANGKRQHTDRNPCSESDQSLQLL